MKQYPLKYKNKIISNGNVHGIHPILLAFRDIKYGLFTYHYPICCIFQFMIETLLCEPSAYKRNEEYKLSEFKGVYVPCNHCMKRIDRLNKARKNETSKIL